MLVVFTFTVKSSFYEHNQAQPLRRRVDKSKTMSKGENSNLGKQSSAAAFTATTSTSSKHEHHEMRRLQCDEDMPLI